MRQSLLLLCLILFPFMHYAQNDLWELGKDEDGIKVYTMLVEGSDFKTFKAQMLCESNHDKMIHTMQNVAGFKNWMPDCEEVQLLKRDSNHQYHYIQTAAPWPVDNRDLIYHLEYQQINESKTIILVQGVPDYLPKKEGVVRMPEGSGSWEITQIDSSKVEIKYQFQANPGGAIPAWLSNTAVIEMPFTTMKNLRKILESKLD